MEGMEGCDIPPEPPPEFPPEPMPEPLPELPTGDYPGEVGPRDDMAELGVAEERWDGSPPDVLDENPAWPRDDLTSSDDSAVPCLEGAATQERPAAISETDGNLAEKLDELLKEGGEKNDPMENSEEPIEGSPKADEGQDREDAGQCKDEASDTDEESGSREQTASDEQQTEKEEESGAKNGEQQDQAEADSVSEEDGRPPTREEIQAEREKIEQADEKQHEMREQIKEEWETKTPEERKALLAEYEAVVAQAYGIEPASEGGISWNGSDEMKDAYGYWDAGSGQYGLNESLLETDDPTEALATLEHECSHRSDQEKGLDPIPYFEHPPEAPAVIAAEGVMTHLPGEDDSSYATRYQDYAHDYEQYIFNWEQIGEEDMMSHYVDPPESPAAPEEDNAEAAAAYCEMISRYQQAFDKYTYSAGEWIAREREIKD